MIFNAIVREMTSLSASTTPKSGVTYTAGIGGIEPDVLSGYAALISNNADITNETADVYIDDSDKHYKISVANQVTIALNGTNYAFDVIGFNHDDLTDASAYGATTNTGKAGITLQMHDLFASYYYMNYTITSAGGWKNSVMRTSTMPVMNGYMPTAWQSVVKPVNKTSGLGGSSTSGTEVTSDDCFLLAEVEVFGSTALSVFGEGTQYLYYKAGNSKVKKQSGSSYWWWERSPDSGSGNGYFCCVNSAGQVGGNGATSSYGVAFGFCI